MNLESVSNGLGAPSVLLVVWAIQKILPATVSITADTGWEVDRLWNTGRRSTAKEYFDDVIVPLCKGTHVEARFVRSVDENKVPLPSLRDQLIAGAKDMTAAGIPMFGSNGGRLQQSCTDKMKIRACRQEARRMGATTNRNAQGIHFAEAYRRVKGRFIGMDGEWSVYRTCVTVSGEVREIKWQSHYYPFVDRKMRRHDIYAEMDKLGIPYLISSECDLCPHKDLPRWERSSQETIDDGAAIEALFKGEYFFTNLRIPLKQAIAQMQKQRADNPEFDFGEADFGCSAICGV